MVEGYDNEGEAEDSQGDRRKQQTEAEGMEGGQSKMKLYGRTSNSAIYERQDGKRVTIAKEDNGYSVTIYSTLHGRKEEVASGCTYREARSIATEMYYSK